jgi:hypothetical protein
VIFYLFCQGKVTTDTLNILPVPCETLLSFILYKLISHVEIQPAADSEWVSERLCKYTQFVSMRLIPAPSSQMSMHRLRFWLALSLCFCESIQSSPGLVHNSMPSPKTLKLATFNIRFGGPQDPTNAPSEKKFGQERSWYERREGLVDQVIWEEPDVIGFQEVGLSSRCYIVLSSPLRCRFSTINLMIFPADLGLHIAMSALDEMTARPPAKPYPYFGERKRAFCPKFNSTSDVFHC